MSASRPTSARNGGSKMAYQLTRLPIPRCTLGEGPLWHAEKGELMVTDIDGMQLHVLHWASMGCRSVLLPQKAGFIALAKGGYALGLEDGVYFLAEDALNRQVVRQEDLHLLHQPMKIPGCRFNDGKPGPDGRLYAGTLDVQGGAELLRIADGWAEEAYGPVSVSNGMAWTKDGHTMYYCDTYTRRIDGFSFSKATGRLSQRRTVCDFSELHGNPDGFCLDCAGQIWAAVWGEGAVYRIHPASGTKCRAVEVPGVRHTSSCTFAGPHLDWLVITTAARPGEAASGYTYCCQVDAAGDQPYEFTQFAVQEGNQDEKQ